MENTMNKPSKFDKIQFAENQYNKLSQLYITNGFLGLLDRPLRPTELSDMHSDVESEMQSKVENIYIETDKHTPNITPFLQQTQNDIEANIENGSLKSMSDFHQIINHDAFLNGYHAAYPNSAVVDKPVSQQLDPIVSPEVLNDRTNAQKMGMLMNAINNSGLIDEPINDAREILIYRTDVADVQEHHSDNMLSDYIQPQISDKSAERLKVAIVMDAKYVNSAQKYFQAYKVDAFHVSNATNRNIIFDKAEPIDIPGVAEISTSLVENVQTINRQYRRYEAEGFTYPDLTDVKSQIVLSNSQAELNNQSKLIDESNDNPVINRKVVKTDTGYQVDVGKLSLFNDNLITYINSNMDKPNELGIEPIENPIGFVDFDKNPEHIQAISEFVQNQYSNVLNPIGAKASATSMDKIDGPAGGFPDVNYVLDANTYAGAIIAITAIQSNNIIPTSIKPSDVAFSKDIFRKPDSVDELIHNISKENEFVMMPASEYDSEWPRKVIESLDIKLDNGKTAKWEDFADNYMSDATKQSLINNRINPVTGADNSISESHYNKPLQLDFDGLANQPDQQL